MTRIIVAALTLHAAVAAAQQPSEAERLYTNGQKAYDEKHYDDALAAWEKSYELSHLPGLLFNIGQAYRLRAQPGDCVHAVDTYNKFLQLDRTSPQRATATKLVEELQPCANAERTRNATLPATFAPAQPAAPGGASPGAAIDAPSNSKKTIAYMVGGGSVVLLAVGAYYGHKARTLGDEVTAACANGCDWATVADKDATGHNAARTQWIFYGVGVAGLATAGVLYWLGGKESSRVAIAPHGTDGAVVTWSSAW